MNAIAYAVAAVIVAGLLWDVARRLIASRADVVREDYDKRMFDLRFDVNKLRDQVHEDMASLEQRHDSLYGSHMQQISNTAAAGVRICTLTSDIEELRAARPTEHADVSKFNAATMNLAKQLQELSGKVVTRETLDAEIKKLRAGQAGMVAGMPRNSRAM